MYSEVNSINEQKGQEYNICAYCHNCEPNDVFMMLECEHVFCVACIALMHTKFQKQLNDRFKLKCVHCAKISDIQGDTIQLIKDVMESTIFPALKKQKQFSIKIKDSNSKDTYSKDRTNQLQIMTVNKKGNKSEEHSIEKITPSNRAFHSKCQTQKEVNSRGNPSHNQHQTKKQNCQLHIHDQLTINCLTCKNELLCIKCATSKKHHQHEMKSIQKSMDILQEQIAQKKLIAKQQIQFMQLWKKRLADRKSIIAQRWEKNTKQISMCFQELIARLKKKQKALMEHCQTIFGQLSEQIKKESDRLDQNLSLLKAHIDRLDDNSRNSQNCTQFIRKSTQIMNENHLKKINCVNFDFFDQIPYPSQTIHKQISQIAQGIEKLNIQYKISNFIHKIKTLNVQNSKSNQKILSNIFKRVKTNMVSLNSSRDRKDKKSTKTEEDERKNRSKAALKTESSKLAKANNKGKIPMYINQFFANPLNKLADGEYHQDLMEANTMQNSFKYSSKNLSKTQIPFSQLQNFQKKKKKDHTAIIKERLERKTAKDQKGEACVKRKKINL